LNHGGISIERKAASAIAVKETRHRKRTAPGSESISVKHQQSIKHHGAAKALSTINKNSIEENRRK